MMENIYIIILVNLIFYFKTLRYGYVSDDVSVYVTQQKEFSSIYHKILYWIEGRIRWNPQFDHALTTLIHSLVCVGIYLGFGKNNISFLAALLFSFNPANNQASVWVAGRPYAMPALFLTWTLAIPVLGPAFLVLATHYNAGFLAPIAFLGSPIPFMLAFAPLAWATNFSQFKRNVKQKIDREMFKEDREFKMSKFVLAIKTFGYYTTISLIPFKTSFYHNFLQSAAGVGKEKAYTMKDKYFFLGLIYLIAILSYWIIFPWNVVSFGLFWWCITIAPFLNFFRMSQEIAERYMYLPNCGLMVALSYFIHTNPFIVGIFLSMYATKMWFYMEAYFNDNQIVEYACINSPKSWYAWHIRGLKRWENKSYQEAIIMWTMARMLSPKEFKVNLNIATALKLHKADKESEQFFQIAKDNIPQGQESEFHKIIDDWKNNNMAVLV